MTARPELPRAPRRAAAGLAPDARPSSPSCSPVRSCCSPSATRSGAKGRHQRAADLAAISAAQVMRDLYPRLFEPPVPRAGVPNPRHLARPATARARRGGGGARRRGATAFASTPADVELPGRRLRADARRVRVRGEARVAGRSGRSRAARGAPIPVRARATAELSPDRRWRCPAPRRRRLRRPARIPPGQADAARRRARLRPHGGRRARGRPGSCWSSRAAFAPTPSRRGCSPPTPTRSGSRRPARACTATPPSSTWARPPPTAGWPPTPPASASCSATRWEPWHYGYTRSSGSASVGFGAARRRRAARAQAVPSFVPGRASRR